MSLLDKLRRPPGPGGARGHHAHDALDPTVRMLRDAAADAQRSRIPQMAAALSYRTVFGMIPILAVGLWVLHRMVTEEQLRSLIASALGVLGLDRFSLSAPPTDTEFVGPVMPTPDTARSVDEYVTALVLSLNKVNFTAIGVVGVILLGYAAVSMIVEIERAFNQIFKVPRGRSWSRRFPNYVTLLVCAPLGVVLTFYLGQRLDAWSRGLAENPTYSFLASAGLTAAILGQFAVSAAVLLVMYTVIPNTRVRFWAALAGAVVGAVLFEGLKFGFFQYVRLTAGASYTRLYGSLALIPLFLLWVYLTWNIVLFGLQFTYQLQYARLKKAAVPLPEFGPMVVEPAAGLLVMGSAARGFASGAPQTVRSLAGQTGLNEGVVTLVVQRMTDRGLLHLVQHDADRSEEAWYALSRPPGAVRVAELLEIGFELAGGSEANETVRRLRRAQVEAAGDETLADSAGLRPDGAPKDVREIAAVPRAGGPAPPAPSGPPAGEGGMNGAAGPGAARPATL